MAQTAVPASCASLDSYVAMAPTPVPAPASATRAAAEDAPVAFAAVGMAQTPAWELPLRRPSAPPAMDFIQQPCEESRKRSDMPARDTLRSYLIELSKEDASRIFIARGINKLGFRSRELLCQHYEQYGQVSRVLVANSKVKPYRDYSGQLRTRPGGLGIIVMAQAASVKRILSMGEEQLVGGQNIKVQCFTRPPQVEDVHDPSFKSVAMSTSASNSTFQQQRSDESGSRSPEGSSEPCEKCDADIGSSGAETPESTN